MEKRRERLGPAGEIYIKDGGQKIHIKLNQIHPKQIKCACTVDSAANREGRAVGDLTSAIKDRISKTCVDLNKM